MSDTLDIIAILVGMGAAALIIGLFGIHSALEDLVVEVRKLRAGSTDKEGTE